MAFPARTGGRALPAGRPQPIVHSEYPEPPYACIATEGGTALINGMSADSSAAASAEPFQALDDSKISRFQIKTMFVSGMGFFTDAYDLFVIGIVVSILKPSGR